MGPEGCRMERPVPEGGDFARYIDKEKEKVGPMY